MNISKISRFIIFLKRNLTLTAQAGQRKSSTNKNIKKLRTICMVSTLTYSWQHWVSEVNDKQAKEPFAWAPDALREL